MYIDQKLLEAIESEKPVDGLTHGFYKYPARFSPQFVRASIQSFSEPGDVILDPFMGGGTTAVEARVTGRHFVGTDLNSLSVFLARTKTTDFNLREVSAVRAWVDRLIPTLKVTAKTDLDVTGLNMSDADTWRIRKTIQLCLSKLMLLETRRMQNLARCIVLRTSQWALDSRKHLPNTTSFKAQLENYARELLSGAEEFSNSVFDVERCLGWRSRMRFIQCSADAVARQSIWRTLKPPKLVLTSPPYPGVHVLYHRWQIRGRKETSAPYWITGTLDGNGASFYTFGGRSQKNLTSYFDTAERTFSSVASICSDESLVVQMVSFSETKTQLPRYLEAMEKAGLTEVKIDMAVQSDLTPLFVRIGV